MMSLITYLVGLPQNQLIAHLDVRGICCIIGTLCRSVSASFQQRDGYSNILPRNLTLFAINFSKYSLSLSPCSGSEWKQSFDLHLISNAIHIVWYKSMTMKYCRSKICAFKSIYLDEEQVSLLRSNSILHTFFWSISNCFSLNNRGKIFESGWIRSLPLLFSRC